MKKLYKIIIIHLFTLVSLSIVYPCVNCSIPVAKFLASGIPQRKCISLECGLQNGTLAVFVASQLFSDITFLIPTAAYALIMFVTSIIFVFIVRKIN